MNTDFLTWNYFQGFSGEPLPLRAELNEWFDWSTPYRAGDPCPACGETMHRGTYTWYCANCSFVESLEAVLKRELLVELKEERNAEAL